ncbi:MAG: hypothetical protein ACI9YE_000460 [Psychroserpens sp.]|jgi:hypothetical protein
MNIELKLDLEAFFLNSKIWGFKIKPSTIKFFKKFSSADSYFIK